MCECEWDRMLITSDEALVLSISILDPIWADYLAIQSIEFQL